MVIVESPAKAKTINKYLGSGFVVKACKGHVRDLPPSRYGIDPGRNFEPEYEILAGSEKTIRELKKQADAANIVYLATDMDREGEAIAWHLSHALELSPEKTRRVIFNEITKNAITEAFAQPHEIDQEKVDAQQARRILDRIVGYELSPLLWKKVSKGLSAGRVQSVAVRLICERESAIREFKPEEYWTIDAVFATDPKRSAELGEQWNAFVTGGKGGDAPVVKDRLAWLADRGCVQAVLVDVGGKPFRPTGTLDTSKGSEDAFESAVDRVRPLSEALGFKVKDTVVEPWEDYAHLGLKRVRLEGRIEPANSPDYAVKSIDTKRIRSKAPAPFTTASLQQSGANQLRFAASRTMRVAQALYEGVDIKTGEGNVGLITYMRTDSTNLSKEAVGAIRGLIGDQYGEKYLPQKPNVFGKAKKAQEAHEAVRPSDATRTPSSLKGHLTTDQLKLYTLIWNRAVASQMLPAEWDSTTALISAQTELGEAVFKATGRVLVFDGFYRVAGVPKSSEEQILPKLETKQSVAPLSVVPSQKFTSPPPRFTEASLVKTLEAEGIGRPSTYASIIQTIQDRGYVEQTDRRFYATARGEVVTEKLVKHFPKIMEIGFTSFMEDELDKVEEAHLDWHAVLHEFYDPFKEALARAHEEMEAVKAEPSEYACDKCGKPMVYRLGKNGRFLACTGYPECSATKDVDRDGKAIDPVVSDLKCEKCDGMMIMRRSRHGPFLGCDQYPECDQTHPCDDNGVALKKVDAESISATCDDCNAPMGVRFFRSKAFLGCSKYPECKATKPLPDGVYVKKPPPEDAGVRCDKCGRKMVIRKSRRGPFLSCSGFPRCRNAKPMDKLDELKELEAQGKIPDPPPEQDKNGKNGRGGKNGRAIAKRGPAKKVNLEELGPPPKGFAWTRTGRPVVETWPKAPLSCPNCSAEMQMKTGRFGPFFSCAGCRNAVNLRGEAKKRAEVEMPAPARPKPIPTDVACPDCGGKMLLRMGRTGRFLGCGAYPKCKKTMEAPPGLLREVAETANDKN
ncbi:MAG: type I DNA topoisomerase [Planctomycetota bacterium]|nr:type I DNA topoisomerase [Planctomycetota bacterium]